MPPMTGREGEVALLENGKAGSCEQVRRSGGSVAKCSKTVSPKHIFQKFSLYTLLTCHRLTWLLLKILLKDLRV